MRIRPLFALGLSAALSLAGTASASNAQVPPAAAYPTDACVAEKLRATALYCRAALDGLDRGRAKNQLANAWDRAEAKSLEAGVSCADTTATADEIAASLDASAAVISSSIATSTAADAKSERRCESYRQGVVAHACRHLLQAESAHMLTRSVDRTRSELERRETRAAEWLESQWSNGAAKSCSGGPSAEEAQAAVDAAVDEALLLTYVSPRVSSTEWTRIDPDDQVSYGDKTLEPTCGDGGAYSFFVKRGSVNKTVMYYEGGGACWSFLTCSLPTYKTSVGGGPGGATTGFADLNDERNPLKDWNAVFVPYCTGDVHWGDAVVDHTQGQGQNQRTITIRHKGFVNAQVAEKWAREHFSNPEQVFVTGSSAGGYGAAVNALPLQEYVWPSSDFAVLGDAANGVIPQDFLVNHLPKWGIEQNLPDWIPGLNRPLSELTAADLWSEQALFYPNHRFANYATSYDGGQGGQVGFYQVMLHPLGGLDWLFWWRPSCEWNSIMRGLVQDAASAAPNYRYYIGSGSRHTMYGNDKVYSDTTGNVPLLVDWVTAMLEGTPDWVNVETDDPGLLLPGDPRPTPTLEDPYYPDDGGRIFCE